jgi:hypothetical protein
VDDVHGTGTPGDRAQRVVTMLDRWHAHDVADEPEWDATVIRPLKLRSLAAEEALD